MMQSTPNQRKFLLADNLDISDVVFEAQPPSKKKKVLHSTPTSIHQSWFDDSDFAGMSDVNSATSSTSFISKFKDILLIEF